MDNDGGNMTYRYEFVIRTKKSIIVKADNPDEARKKLALGDIVDEYLIDSKISYWKHPNCLEKI